LIKHFITPEKAINSHKPFKDSIAEEKAYQFKDQDEISYNIKNIQVIIIYTHFLFLFFYQI